MSPLRLNGSTSGFTSLDAPAVAGSNTLVLPTGNGSSGQVLSTNGSGALSWSTVVQPAVALTAATAVASTSGTSIDFTGIPSGVKRITVIFQGISTNGSSIPIVQLGTSGGIQTTSYAGTTGLGSTYNTAYSSGFCITGTNAASYQLSGIMTIVLLNSSSSLWVASVTVGDAGGSNLNATGGGHKTLSGALDRVRITTVNGTDTFDAGSINILYEG